MSVQFFSLLKVCMTIQSFFRWAWGAIKKQCFSGKTKLYSNVCRLKEEVAYGLVGKGSLANNHLEYQGTSDTRMILGIHK